MDQKCVHKQSSPSSRGGVCVGLTLRALQGQKLKLKPEAQVEAAFVSIFQV